MGIALGIKAEWLLTPCRGSIQSYEGDDMLPFQGAEFLSLFLPQGDAVGLMICCHFVAYTVSALEHPHRMTS
jgi:hypothetical protein